MFSRLRNSPSAGSSVHESNSYPSSKTASIISSVHESSKAPSIVSSSSRRSTSTLREPSIAAPSSHLYQRPITPAEDFVNSDAYSNDLHFPSLTPSEFSVDAVYRRKQTHPGTPDTVSTTTENRESSPSRDSGYSGEQSPNVAGLARLVYCNLFLFL